MCNRRWAAAAMVVVALAAAGPASAAAPPARPFAAPPAAPTAAPAGARDLPRSAVPADEARSTARRVLARPEYRRVGLSLPRRLIDEVVAWLEWLFRRPSVPTPGGAPAQPSGLLLVALAALALVILVRFVRPGRWRSSKKTTKDVVLGQGRRPTDDWLADARRFEAEGRWRDAIRCHWRALVAELAERDFVTDDAGRTTGDHRREVARTLPGLSVPFSEATSLFEQAWYSPHTVGSPHLAKLKTLQDTVRSGLPDAPIARFRDAETAGTQP